MKIGKKYCFGFAAAFSFIYVVVFVFVCISKVYTLENDDVLPELDTLKDYLPRESTKGFSFLADSYFSQFLFRRRRSSEPIRRNRCELKLVADYEFFRVIGNNNYANAARYLVNMIERINGIFTQVDWGIDINGNRLVNLGFSIKEIKIFDRPTSTLSMHFNSMISARNDGSFSSLDVLKSFSAEEGTNGTCLTILISAKIFDFGILGMANIGHADERGLCATKPYNDTYMNTAVISVRRKSELMITRVVDLVVAHELGHTWGSFHDDSDDFECVPPNSKNGRYVMHESSNSGYDKNNYNFSPCSIKSVHKVLYELAHKCFVEEKAALCGNGILETGEECDAGNQLLATLGKQSSNDTQLFDACCTSECKLRKHAVCSPRHSECCSQSCHYATRQTLCQPTSVDTCSREAFCTGNSSKCPQALPVNDNSDCADEGKCQKGKCISYCRLYSDDSTPCICENVAQSCQRCCRSAKTGMCKPIIPIRFLAEGSICIQGQCHNNVCEKKLTDKASLWTWFKKFQENPNPKFFADNFVFIIVVFSLLIWCPCGALIVYKDKKRHFEVLQSSREDDVYVVAITKKNFQSFK